MGRMVRIFSGRVQGVGFRDAARSVARRFVVTGWVRNEPDGSVRLEVQGEAGEVVRYLDALRERMSGYILEERGSEAAPVVGEVGFEIEY